jgi:hypothetical protein
MPTVHRSVRTRSWLVACTLLAAGLRAWDIAGQSLWSDEDITLDRARTALGAMLAGLPGEHAPLYFTLMRGWTRLAGDGDLALRYPSLLAGVLTVPLGYAVARRLTDRPTACATALLLAVNPFLVGYGQEARMYALVGTLTLATLAAALAADARTRAGARAGRPARALWLTCGALAAATVYTHYYGVLLAAALAAWGLPDVIAWLRRSRSERVAAARRRGDEAVASVPPDGDSTLAARARGWLTAGTVAAALFAPWLPRALRVADHPGWRDDLPLFRVPGTLAVAWSAQTGVTAGRAADGWASAATAMSLGLLTTGVVAWFRRARRSRAEADRARDDSTAGEIGSTRRIGARRALLWLGAMAVVAAIALIRKPDYHPRYLYPLLGVWFMATAAGARVLARRFGVAGWLPLAALVALWVPPLTGYYTDPAQRKTDYRRLVHAVLKAAPADQSRVFLDGPSSGLTERYVPAGADLKVENVQSDKNSELKVEDPAAFEARIDDLARRRPHLWLATDGAAKGWADGWLATNAYPVTSTGIGDVTLERWYVPLDGDGTPAVNVKHPDYPGGPAVPPIFVNIWEGDRPFVARAGEVWAIRLTWLPGGVFKYQPPWRDEPPARRPHNVSVRLVDDAGNIVASADREPAAGAAPTTGWLEGDEITDRHGLLIPAATPSGPYHLSIVLYDEATLVPAFTWSHAADVHVEPVR